MNDSTPARKAARRVTLPTLNLLERNYRLVGQRAGIDRAFHGWHILEQEVPLPALGWIRALQPALRGDRTVEGHLLQRAVVLQVHQIVGDLRARAIGRR